MLFMNGLINFVNFFFDILFLSTKREREEDNAKSRTYPASSIPRESMLLAVRLFEVLERRGIKQTEFVSDLGDAGYLITYRSFSRHIHNYKLSGSVFKIDKESGAIPLLCSLEKEIASGFVFDQNTKKQIVSVKSYKDFVLNELNIDISLSTARNYLYEAGFSCRLISSKSRGFHFDGENERDILAIYQPLQINWCILCQTIQIVQLRLCFHFTP